MAQVAAKVLDMFCKFYFDKNCNNNIGPLAVETRILFFLIHPLFFQPDTVVSELDAFVMNPPGTNFINNLRV